jgi:hypothetical protein
MKKLSILIIGIFILFSSNLNAQCKFAKITKAYHKAAKSEDCIVPLNSICTKPIKIMGNGISNAAAASLVKSGEEFYLYFNIYRGSSSKFEIHKNNSLVLLFDNGEPVSIFPCGDFTPKALPLLDCNIGCFYNINKEQIKQIADNGRMNSFILHVSADKEIPSAQIEEDGTMFFEYEISSEKLGTNLSQSAACILTK